MKNFDNEIRKSIESIQPDMYMKTRLSAKISGQTKPKKSHLWKKIGASALALVIVCGSLGGYYATQDKSNPDFAIVAYANDGSSHVLSDDEIILTDFHFIYDRDDVKDGESPINYMGSERKLDFGINAENVAEATFESENYGFWIYDDNMSENQFERDDYYIVKIPLNDEEIIKFSEIDVFEIENRTEKAFLKEMMENRDLSEYFGDNSMNVDDYHIYRILDNSSEIVEYYGLEEIGYITSQFYLVKNDVYENISRYGKTVTAKNYNDDDRIHGIAFFDWNAVELLNENPDMKLSDLPKDNITVTVTFKSGETATKHILAEFDDDGYLHCKLV